MHTYTIDGRVQQFPQAGGWYYVAVPQRYTKILHPLTVRGLIAVHAVVGEVSWDTSLLPMGDGTHFIPLPAKVRRTNQLDVGSCVNLTFTIRRSAT